MKTTIFINREDASKTEAEEQYKFIKFNIEALDLDLDINEILPDLYIDFTADKKIKLRELLNKFNVLILNDGAGQVQIIMHDENTKSKQVIAEWKKCRFDLKIDISEPNPNKRLYMAMHIDCWSVFEEK